MRDYGDTYGDGREYEVSEYFDKNIEGEAAEVMYEKFWDLVETKYLSYKEMADAAFKAGRDFIEEVYPEVDAEEYANAAYPSGVPTEAEYKEVLTSGE